MWGVESEDMEKGREVVKMVGNGWEQKGRGRDGW